MYFPPDSPHLYIPPVWASLSDFFCEPTGPGGSAVAGCGARSTSECMGDVGQGTTLPRLSNGYMRPCFTPFVSGAYVLAPAHASTSHLPPLSLYHHGPWRLCSGCDVRSTMECMGDVGQGTTLPRPSNGYTRPCFTPFVSGAYVLAPSHTSTSHLPPEPLSAPRALEALQWLWCAVYHGVYEWRWSRNNLAKTF